MKFSLILFCSFSALFFCHGALQKTYFNGNGHNYFIQKVDGEENWGRNDRTVEGIGKLTTSLLHDVHSRAGKRFNIVLSPVSIWTMLAMLLEGASGRTENELKTKLQLSYNSPEEGRRMLRSRYNKMRNFLGGMRMIRGAGNSSTEFTSLNFVISDRMKMIKPTYVNIVREFYNGQSFLVDPREKDRFSAMINAWAVESSRNRIRTIVTPAMLDNLALIIGNAVYFKSKWEHPFDPSQTISLPFTDENERVIRNIPMMNQFIVLPYFYNRYIESQVVEIPYYDGRTSMIVILPRERISLVRVLSKMKDLSLERIIPRNVTEENVQLSLPKFHVVSKMQLNDVLRQDLQSMFNQKLAEFPYIGRDMYVSKMSHKAEIENTEEGTSASGVSSVQFAFKTAGIAFQANRPFIYLIMDSKTRTILFAGTYTNPFTG